MTEQLTFRFTLVLGGVVRFPTDQWTDLENGLHPAGCDDATLSISCGVIYLDFDRQAESALAAVTSALADAGKVATVDYVSFASPARITTFYERKIARDMTAILTDPEATEDEKRMALTTIIDATLS